MDFVLLVVSRIRDERMLETSRVGPALRICGGLRITIRLHDPDFKRTRKNILFPGNKKVRFLNFLRNRGLGHEFHEFGAGFDLTDHGDSQSSAPRARTKRGSIILILRINVCVF
jgi:hypothetical protein